MNHPEEFIVGERIYLRKLKNEDFNERYLSWLNDTEILQWRSPKAYPSDMQDLKNFAERAKSNGDLHLAICLKDDDLHVGNISLNSIQWVHRSAELSIMVGDKSQWGQGVGSEAIKILTDHGFKNMGLNRIWAESPNPGFNKAVQKCGWTKEGLKRKAFLFNGEFIDFECYSILLEEWKN